MAKKTNAALSIILTLASVAAAFAAVNAVLFGVRYHKISKKMNANSDKNNFMYSLLFGKKKIKIKSDTDNIYINCLTGDLTIDLPQNMNKRKINLEVCSLFGKVTVNLPLDAKVIHDGSGFVESVRDERMRSDDASSYILRVTRHNIFSKLIISADNKEKIGKRKYFTA